MQLTNRKDLQTVFIVVNSILHVPFQISRMDCISTKLFQQTGT